MNPLALIVVAAVAGRFAWNVRTSERHAVRMLEEGGVEFGRAQYPVLLTLYIVWLLVILVQVPDGAPIAWPLLILFGFLVMLQRWIRHSLGRYWTLRIVSMPGVPEIRTGPYRYLRHPDYFAMVVEVALLPFAFGLWRTAVLFSLVLGAFLSWRIQVEETALDRVVV